jgi:hypothetical protein
MLGDRVGPFLDDYLRLLAAERHVEADDIMALRTVLDEEFVIDGEVIARLFALDRVVVPSSDWSEFLSETIAKSVHTLRPPAPRGRPLSVGVRRKLA